MWKYETISQFMILIQHVRKLLFPYSLLDLNWTLVIIRDIRKFLKGSIYIHDMFENSSAFFVARPINESSYISNIFRFHLLIFKRPCRNCGGDNCHLWHSPDTALHLPIDHFLIYVTEILVYDTCSRPQFFHWKHSQSVNPSFTKYRRPIVQSSISISNLKSELTTP